MKYINNIYKFMYGRYGIDNLYKFLIRLYIVLVIINIFIKSNILTIIEFILFIFTIYRVFSKDINRRKKENKIYINIINKLNKPFKNIKRNYLDRKDFIYKKCSKCHTTLKLPLPSKRGIKHAKCPKCGKRLTIFSLRQERIEIIKGGKKHDKII